MSFLIVDQHAAPVSRCGQVSVIADAPSSAHGLTYFNLRRLATCELRSLGDFQMPSPFEVVVESSYELHDAIASPFEDDTIDLDVEINDRRAAAENAEALRLARAL